MELLVSEITFAKKKIISRSKTKTKAPPVKTKKKGLSYNSHLGSRIKRSKSGYFIQFQHLYQTNHRIPANYRKTQSYKALQRVTRGYKWLQGVTRGYKRVTKGYNGLQRVTKGYKVLERVTKGYKGLQRVTRG